MLKERKKDHKLFGPYPNVGSARKTVNMINRLYPLRKCEKLPKKECLYYHINECLGYCIKEIDKDTIKSMTDEITSFLKVIVVLLKRKLQKKWKKQVML